MNRTMLTILIMLVTTASSSGYSDEATPSLKFKNLSTIKKAVIQPQTGSPNPDVQIDTRAKLPVYPSMIPLAIPDRKQEKAVKPTSALEEAQRLINDPILRAIFIHKYRQGRKELRLDVDNLPMTEVSREIAIDHPY